MKYLVFLGATLALRPSGRYIARLAAARPLRVWAFGPPLHIASPPPHPDDKLRLSIVTVDYPPPI